MLKFKLVRQQRFIALVALVSLISAACAEEKKSTTPSKKASDDIHTVENIAHRGGSDNWPEETLTAFKAAYELGVDVLELDVRATSDGVLVLNHDSDVDRTSNGSGKIADMTYDQLAALDFGYYFKENGSYPWRGKGVTIAKLSEVLAALPKAKYVLEIKQYEPSIVDDVATLIRDADMVAQFTIGSFEDDTIEELRSRFPEFRTGFSAEEISEFLGLADEELAGYVAPAEAMQLPAGSVNESVIRMARELDLEVQVWTVNDQSEMQKMIELGVDGIITDDAILLDSVLAQENARTH